MMITEKKVKRAIKAMDAAREALSDIVNADDPRDSVSRLIADLAEYSDYIERAKWWRRSESA